MKLVIRHSYQLNGGPGQLSFHATYYLREPGTEPFVPPQLDPRLGQHTLSELAKRWYLINRPSDVPDANEALLAGNAEADAPLDALIAKGGREAKAFELKTDDAILVAAVDERVRRAVAMILEDAVYSHYIIATPEQNFELGSKEHEPSGHALPLVSKAIRDKVIEDGSS